MRIIFLLILFAIFVKSQNHLINEAQFFILDDFKLINKNLIRSIEIVKTGNTEQLIISMIATKFYSGDNYDEKYKLGSDHIYFNEFKQYINKFRNNKPCNAY